MHCIAFGPSGNFASLKRVEGVVITPDASALSSNIVKGEKRGVSPRQRVVSCRNSCLVTRKAQEIDYF